MRKIENFVMDVLVNKSCGAGQNTSINYSTETDTSNVFLHGNHIFSYNHSTHKFIWNDCGFPTKTTASRLNACFKGLQYITGRSYYYTYSRTNKTGSVINTYSKEEIPAGNFSENFS